MSGPSGALGPTGVSGPSGPSGEQGNTGASGETGAAYEVQLTDESGGCVMRWRLPVQIVESAVLLGVKAAIAMAPDGGLSVQFESPEDTQIPEAGLAIDFLIERSLSPAMLEDETGVERMIEILRRRLQRAVNIADAALARLR